MDLSTLIPQLFYDVIGRIIPGAALLASTLILLKGPEDGLHYLTAWSGRSSDGTVPTTLIVLGNLLASHIVASLIGGLWFRIYRFGNKWREHRIGKHLVSWAVRGERLIERLIPGPINDPHLNQIHSITGKIAYLYDLILFQCPKAGARIAKLRAEQHMSGVLMIGFSLLAIFCYWFPFIRDTRHSGLTVWAATEALLGLAVLSAGSLAWHLEKRCGLALYNHWLLLSSSHDEK